MSDTAWLVVIAAMWFCAGFTWGASYGKRKVLDDLEVEE
jgi:hypothetical protein